MAKIDDDAASGVYDASFCMVQGVYFMVLPSVHMWLVGVNLVVVPRQERAEVVVAYGC